MTDRNRLVLAASDIAPATQAAYETDWRAFTTWCHRHGSNPLPSDPDTVLRWLADQEENGYATSTIARRLLTIRRMHLDPGYTSPTDTPEVQIAWRRARRRLGTATRKVAPITIDVLRQMVTTCPPSPAGLRDHALLVIGFAGALRRSEIADLNLADIERHADGLILTIRRSKGDQHGAGHRLGLPRGTAPSTCPERTLSAWAQQLNPASGPLFRPVDRHGNIAARHLSGRAVAEIIKRRAAAAGLNPDRYSGHSLRAGFATSAALTGASEITIARQTRHRSMSVLRGYIREGDLFKLNAATTVGL